MSGSPESQAIESLDDFLPDLIAVSKNAGRRILDFFEKGVDAEEKSDASPVTEADRAAERVILDAITALTPEIPIIAEESFYEQPVEHKEESTVFWLVDPLDGTREFLAGRDEFTVNIGLIANNAPIFGIVHLPARNETFWGHTERAFHQNDNEAAKRIRVRESEANNLTAVASRSHRTPAVDAFLRALSVKKTVSAGSSLKFCVVAMAEADVYPRFGPTMEWDTAAGHAVLVAAGGRVLTTQNVPLLYGKSGYRNPDFIAWGGSPVPAKLHIEFP